MFHWRDNIYWERLCNGSVRIRKFVTTPRFDCVDWQSQPTEFDITIPGSEW